MNRKIATVLLLTALASAQAQESAPKRSIAPAANSCELTENDYAVYAALLEGIGSPEDPEEAWSGKEFLLLDKTADTASVDGGRRGWGFRSKSKQAPHEETIADFTAKKGISCPVRSGFGNPSAYSVISASETDQYFQKSRENPRTFDGWTVCYKKHPNSAGFWQFSLPGYNSRRDEALVYVVHSCGWLCGTGHLYLLTKDDGVWRVKNRLMLWIS